MPAQPPIVPALILRTLAALLLLITACGREPPPQGELRFLDGGILGPPGSGGRPVGGEQEWVARAWTPGEAVTLGGIAGRAPAQAECLPLFSVDLGDVERLVALGGTQPSTALRWSPDGDRLLVGSQRGEVLVLDGWTGAVLARKKLAETMIKAVAWSADGRTAYAAEQSPDAFVLALDPADLRPRWRFRVADELGTSPVPPATDVYGVFALPSAHQITPLPGGDLLVAGVHSWPTPDGHRNRSRLWRLSPEGAVVAAWPKPGPADAVLRLAALDAAAGIVALPVTRSATGPAPVDLPVGGVQLLSLPDLRPLGTRAFHPLPPHFTSAYVWEAFDVRGDPPEVLAGFGDGRLELIRQGDRSTLDLGTPILSGTVPIAASVGWGRFLPHGAAAITDDTNIPWGSAATATRPPAAHPGSNTLFLVDDGGRIRWSWHGEQHLTGLSPMGDDRLVVGAGARAADQRRDLWGALVFDVGAAPKLLRTCPTDGPVFFHHDATGDGRIAVSVLPWKDEDGAVRGAYRVAVLR